MTRDEIIGMAREAGLKDLGGANMAALERFAALVAAAERESIAQMIEDAPTLMADAQNNEGGCLICGFTPRLAAAAIRVGGQTPTARMCPSTYYECQRNCGEGGCKDFEDAHQRSQA